jgi:hypothetical protein
MLPCFAADFFDKTIKAKLKSVSSRAKLLPEKFNKALTVVPPTYPALFTLSCFVDPYFS